MKSYRPENRSSGGGSRGPKQRSFGGGGGGGYDRSDRPSVMHPATCSTCGVDCEVPFRPTGSKPVLCKVCFNKGGANSSWEADGKRFPRKQSSAPQAPDNIKKQLDSIESKLNQILEFLNDEDNYEDDDSEE
jgi:CxxC-x17-CxxC domain-containing protein